VVILGEFSPIGRVFTLCIFWKLQKKPKVFWATVFDVTNKFWQKELGIILGDFLVTLPGSYRLRKWKFVRCTYVRKFTTFKDLYVNAVTITDCHVYCHFTILVTSYALRTAAEQTPDLVVVILILVKKKVKSVLDDWTIYSQCFSHQCGEHAYLVHRQCDHIGRNFVAWVIVCLGQFFNIEVAHIFWLL
jgi:hypothetical protein